MVDGSTLPSRLEFFEQSKARLEARRREGRLTDDAGGRIERLQREIDHVRARLRGASEVPPRPTYPGASRPQSRADWDPVGAEYEAHLERIKSSPEFVRMTHALASAMAVEELAEARTTAAPEDVREFAKRHVVDVVTCAHGAYTSPRAIGAVHGLMQEASERKNREGAGWWAFLTHLFRRPSEVIAVEGLRLEPGGYPDGFPARVKDQVGYVLHNLRLNCPELGERLRTLTGEQRDELESVLQGIADKWAGRERQGRRQSPRTMASLVSDALGLSMPEDPRVKRER